MAISYANAKLSDYINKYFVGGKTDLFSAFIEKCLVYAATNGYVSMITMHSWMFLTSFEKIREKILNYEMFSMAHLGARGFDEISGEIIQTTAFVISKNQYNGEYIGTYLRLVDGNSEAEKEKDFFKKESTFFRKGKNFNNVLQKLFAYWVGENTINCFTNDPFSKAITTREGMATADNDKFLKMWYEVAKSRITLDCVSTTDSVDKKVKCVPYNKGGTTRKWYGNNDYVVDWANDGSGIKNNKDKKTGRIRSHNYNAEYSCNAEKQLYCIAGLLLSECEYAFHIAAQGVRRS